MIATSDNFSYIRHDGRGKPYTIKVNFTAMPQSYEISQGEPADIISIMAQEIDEETGFQRIDNYYIKEANGEYSIGIFKNHQYNPINSEMLDELKQLVLSRYEDALKERG
jgi:hypothetical protein